MWWLKSESSESVIFLKNFGFRFGSDLARNFLINWKMQQGAALLLIEIINIGHTLSDWKMAR